MPEFDWSGVRERVVALATHHGARRVFGASGHRFVLAPPLTRPALAHLEQHTGVRLPDDYRSFLLEVGSGGAGPGYGLIRVRRAGGTWGWDEDRTGATDVARLGVPFDGYDGNVRDDHYDRHPVEEDFSDEQGFTAAWRSWVRRLDEIEDEEVHGAIGLSHQGCNYYWRLVVSGSERGNMWDDSRAADVMIPVRVEGSPRVAFGQWYLAWLDEAEAIVAATSAPDPAGTDTPT